MGRPRRVTEGGLVYHVLNRANARRPIFEKDGDFLAFEQIMVEMLGRTSMRLLAYCLMPNHWHLVLWPHQDGDLSDFIRLLTLTHTQRWHAHRQSAGTGHLYQGRFKSFVVQTDPHFLAVCRYVERNALRAGLVKRAEDWRWSSLWHHRNGESMSGLLPGDWPVDRPRNWIQQVNEPQSETELGTLRLCVNRGAPFGGSQWLKSMTKRLGLETTLRPRGRPRLEEKGS